MGFFKDFFGKKHDTEDEERGGTSIIFPERVMAIILLVKKDASLPSQESAQRELVWQIFRLVNPALFEVLPDRAQVKTHIYQTPAMRTDGYIEPDDYIDPLDDLDIPNMASGYIQALKITKRDITIWLREAGTQDKTFRIELDEPFITKGFMPFEDASLITIYASDMPKLMSTLWPALPKSLD